MSTEYKGIDIVILPPENITNKSIEFNEKILDKQFINLNRENQIPHITLLMGGMKINDIDLIWERILKIVEKVKVLTLTINEIRVKSTYSGLHILRTPELDELHSSMVREIMPLLRYDNDLSCIAEYPNVQEKTLTWLNGFSKSSILEKYNPHITLGDGRLNDLSEVKLPIAFNGVRIAICHLGDYCSCHWILREITL